MTPLEVAQLVSLIVSGIVSLAVLFGVGVYFTERARHKAGKKNQKEDDEEARIKASYKEELRAVIREENKPLEDKIEKLDKNVVEMKGDLADNTVGTVTILRDRMKAILDDCRDKGYASPSTKANWHELYTTYGNLGGNHFKEYVDQWRKTLDDLPDNPPIGTDGNPIINGIIYPNGLRPSIIAPSAKARAPRKKKSDK